MAQENTRSLFLDKTDIQNLGRLCCFEMKRYGGGGHSAFQRLLGTSESPRVDRAVWVWWAASQVREKLPLSWLEQMEGKNVEGEILGCGS